MNIKTTLYACALAVMTGLGMGYSAALSADPGCIGDCFEARYECFAQCGANQQCRAFCQASYLDCRAFCNL